MQVLESPDLEQLLQEYFGHTAFREGQRQVVEAVLAGKDVLAVMPTGSGKSLCYQLPAMLLDGLTPPYGQVSGRIDAGWHSSTLSDARQ